MNKLSVTARQIWHVCILTFLCLYSIHGLAVGNVYFQNNANESFSLDRRQVDNKLDKGDEWNTSGSSEVINGNKNRKVLWYNRNEGITNGKTFYFETDIIDSDGDVVVTLEQKLKGTWRFSNYWMSARAGSQTSNWIDSYNIQSRTFTHKGRSYKIQYRGVYNAGTTSDDIEYVLHDLDANSDLVNTENNSQQLSVLAYNVYAIITQPQGEINDRLGALPDLISGHDVLVISEAFNNGNRDDLISDLSSDYPYATDVVDRSGALEDGGVLILSRYPIITEKQTVYSDCNGSDCLSAKGAMYAKIDKDGTYYHVFGTHTQAWSTSDGRTSRAKQFTQLKSFIDSQSISASEAVIIAGDLNVDKPAYPDEYADMLSILNAKEPLLAGNSLAYSADDSRNNLAEGKEFLDYVLYSKEHLQPTDAFESILLMKSQSSDLWGSWDLSDHFPAYGFFNFE